MGKLEANGLVARSIIDPAGETKDGFTITTWTVGATGGVETACITSKKGRSKARCTSLMQVHSKNQDRCN